MQADLDSDSDSEDCASGRFRQVQTQIQTSDQCAEGVFQEAQADSDSDSVFGYSARLSPGLLFLLGQAIVGQGGDRRKA